MPQIPLPLRAVNRQTSDENQVNQAADAVAWGRLLDAFRAAVDTCDRKDLLFRLDVPGSQFSDALRENGGKHVHLRWLVVVADMAPAGDAKQALAAELAGQLGYDVEERRDLTAEEELAALRAAVRAEFGAAGDRMLDQRRSSKRGSRR